MKKILVFLMVVFLKVYAFSSDIVINIDPNPVAFDQQVRISLVAGFSLQSSTLLVGSERFTMRKVSDELFKINVVADQTLYDNSVIIQCVNDFGDVFDLPVDIKIVQSLSQKNGFEVLDSRKASGIDLDSSKLEVDRLQDKVDILDQQNMTLKDQIKDLEEKLADQEALDLSKKELDKKRKELEELQKQLKAENLAKQKIVDELKEKMLDYNKKQQDLIKKEEILSQIEADLNQKSSELSETELRLQGQQIIVNEERALLQRDRGQLTQDQQALNLNQKQLDQDRLEMQKDRSLLNLSQFQLEQERLGLNEMQDSLNQEQKDLEKSRVNYEKDLSSLSKRQKNVKKDELKLKQKEGVLDDRAQRIKQDYSKLSQDRSSLKKDQQQLVDQKREIRKDRDSVAKERSTVEKLREDIVQKKKVLSKKSTELSKKQQRLDNQQSYLSKQESKLNSERQSIQNMSQKISRQRQNLKALNVSLDKKRSEFDLEKDKFYEDKSQKEAVLAQQRTYIKTLEQDMLNEVSDLSKLEENYLDLSASLQKEVTLLQLEKEKYAQKERSLAEEKQGYNDLELELAVRVEMLKKLGAYIDGQIDLMETHYVKSQESQSSYEQGLDQRVEHINNIAKLIEKRAVKMEKMNDRLAKKNRRLSKRLRKAYEPDYRYSFSPYLGTVVRDTSSSVFDSKEYGVLFKGTVQSQWNLGGGVAFRNYFSSNGSSDSNQQFNTETTYKLFTEYMFNPLEKLTFSSRVMLDGQFFDSSKDMFAALGLVLNYKQQPNFGTFVALDVSDGALFSFGIERLIVAAAKSNHATVGDFVEDNYSDDNAIDYDLSDMQDLDKQDMDDFYFTLNDIVPQKYFYPELKPLDDVVSGWYQAAVQDTVAYGFFKPSKENGATLFKPKQYLSVSDASYALIWAKYLDDIVEPESIDITFSLTSYSEQSYKVQLSLQTLEGKHLNYIVKKKIFYPGMHVVDWVPKYNGYPLPEGQYRIVAEVYTEIVKSNQKGLDVEEELIHRSDIAYKVDALQDLRQSVVVSKEIPFKRNYPYIRKMIDLKMLDKKTRQIASFSATPMTRMEFIVATSKLLVDFGAKIPKITIDYSPYKDWHLVPKKYRPFLATYVSELGYGGDNNSLLNPNKFISKAEAAVILQRFMLWRQDQV